EAGRGGAVVEDVAEVGVAVRGADLGARVAEQVIRARADVRGVERTGEARPAGARLELVGRAEEGLAGDDVDVDPRGVIVPEGAAEGALGRRVLRHLVLHRRQALLEL